MLIGLVGKPNAGKSTFFKAATLAPAEISSRPFTTIKPNKGVAYIRVKCPCKELGIKCDPKQGHCEEGVRFVPTEVLDVAGLVPGASEGKGLGNQFLDDLRRAHAIIHVVDSSGTSDDEGKPGEGDPLHDTRWLVIEFELWLQDIIRRALNSKNVEEELQKRMVGLGIKEAEIRGIIDKHGLPTESSVSTYSQYIRQTKPIVIAANKADLPQSSKWLDKLKSLGAIACSAETELALRLAAKSGLIKYSPGANNFEILSEVKAEQRTGLEKIQKYLQRNGSTGVQQIIEKAVELLNLIVVYPVEDEGKFSDKNGRVLPDAFIVPSTTTSRELAYRVHTDIGEGFVAAIDARTKMKLSAEKPLKDGAIIKIMSKK